MTSFTPQKNLLKKMSKIEIGDLVVATLPNCNPISNLYVVKITTELITCTYMQNNFPVTVQLLPEWVSKYEPVESVVLPMIFA